MFVGALMKGSSTMLRVLSALGAATMVGLAVSPASAAIVDFTFT
jgi:hypothetical protein